MFPPNRHTNNITQFSLLNYFNKLFQKNYTVHIIIFKMRFSTLFLFLVIVTISVLNETEARRKILRGRKTITRTYYKTLGIPAWLSIIFTGLVILGVSGIIFAALQKFIIINNQPPQPTPSTIPLTS